MAFIRTVSVDEADGDLARIYGEAVKRAGRVFHILRIQSLDPAALRASMGLYIAVMFGPSPLSRSDREAIAVAVSRANDCFY